MFRRFSGLSVVTPYLFLAADEGKGSGGATDDPEGDKGVTDTNVDDDGKQSDIAIAVTFASQKAFQDHVDGIIKDRLARERQKSDKAADDAKRKAAEDALAANAEWQKLAEDRAKRIAELEPLQAESESHKSDAEKYRAALAVQLEALRANLPAPIIALLDNLDPIAQMEWISKNGEAVMGKDGKAIIKATNPDAKNTELSEQQRRERAFKVRY